MKIEFCPSGLLHIGAENDQEKADLMQYYCENRTYSGEIYISFSMPEDKYEDGSKDFIAHLAFTAYPSDGHITVPGNERINR